MQSEYTADVFEDAAGGTFVVQVEGRSISSLLFEVVDGNADGAFTINPSTGMIVVSPHSGLDFETVKNYNLTVNAMNMVATPGIFFLSSIPSTKLFFLVLFSGWSIRTLQSAYPRAGCQRQFASL